MTEPTRDDLIALILWLAQPYGGRTPIFALEDWWGNPLGANVRLAETWRAIMGDTGDVPDGAWTMCPTCGQQSVRSAIMESEDA